MRIVKVTTVRNIQRVCLRAFGAFPGAVLHLNNPNQREHSHTLQLLITRKETTQNICRTALESVLKIIKTLSKEESTNYVISYFQKKTKSDSI